MHPWLIACALGNLAFLVFHLAFWRLFDWGRELTKLHWANRAIMQVMNLRLIYVFGLFAALQIGFGEALLGTALGRFVQGGIALFWGLRAIEQVVFFRLWHIASTGIFAAFVAMAGVHIAPLWL